MLAAVRLDTQFHVGSVDRRIFGGFLEHVGRAVYEGIFDPDSPRSDAQGFREDVLDALQTLGMSLIRYPGGNFVSGYDWRDGIGPVHDRPTRPDFAWKTIEPNRFGTDEFLAWCTKLQAQPMLAVNLGTAGTLEAAQLLEYCNLPGGTYWADRRVQGGHALPHGVPLWCLGNEMDGPWQAGHVPAEVYAQRAEQAAIVMRGLDPSIQTVVCGTSARKLNTYLEWDRTVLEYCWDCADYISTHRYSGNERQDSAWYLAEGVLLDQVLDVYLAFDEWNVWYRTTSREASDGRWTRAPHLLEEFYNLEDALVCAQYLASFVRHADTVKIACIAQVVNAIAPLVTGPSGVLIQSTYYPLQLFSQFAHGLALTPAVTTPTYRAADRGDVPMLDVAATLETESATLSAFLINRSLSDDLTVTVDCVDRPIERLVSVSALGGDPKAANTWDAPHRVAPAQGTAELAQAGTLRVQVPTTSLVVVRALVTGVNG